MAEGHEVALAIGVAKMSRDEMFVSSSAIPAFCCVTAM
jgi:hypothetical protein